VGCHNSIRIIKLNLIPIKPDARPNIKYKTEISLWEVLRPQRPQKLKDIMNRFIIKLKSVTETTILPPELK